MFDLLIKNANLPDDRKKFDIAIQNKKIVAVERNIVAEATNIIDATDHASGDNPYFESAKK